MTTLKSLGAIIAGLLTVFIMSIATDILMMKTGLLKTPFSDNSTGFIIFIVFYRCIYNTIGCYIAARLAPKRPMFHAMMLGIIGFVLSIIGSIVMREEGPLWYGIAIILLALPCAWLGGKLKKTK